MKQDMISYLSKYKIDLKILNEYLYSNPEDSYKEINSYNYICNFLKKFDFKIHENFLDLDTSFYAIKGSGHPKVCFLCEYDSIPNEGHITGHNLLTSTSIAAALTLGNLVKDIGGSVILIGCPGEYLGGTKSLMARQGVFDDIDAVLMAHPDTITSESGTSSAIIPMAVKFIGDSGLSFLNKGSYTSLDAMLLTFNTLNTVIKGFPKDVDVNAILSKGGFTPLLIPLESEGKFYIRAKEMELAKIVENKIREIVIYTSKLIRVPYNISLYEPENEELITNRTLNRLFSHNLKENGIINIGEARDITSGLSLGIVSKITPTIHPYFSIVKENSNIKYGTKDFARATISEYAFEEAMKVALALAYTGTDLITNEKLLFDLKSEFYKK